MLRSSIERSCEYGEFATVVGAIPDGDSVVREVSDIREEFFKRVFSPQQPYLHSGTAHALPSLNSGSFSNGRQLLNDVDNFCSVGVSIT
jgi:hypothetical protein